MWRGGDGAVRVQAAAREVGVRAGAVDTGGCWAGAGIRCNHTVSSLVCAHVWVVYSVGMRAGAMLVGGGGIRCNHSTTQCVRLVVCAHAWIVYSMGGRAGAKLVRSWGARTGIRCNHAGSRVWALGTCCTFFVCALIESCTPFGASHPMSLQYMLKCMYPVRTCLFMPPTQ